MRRLTFCGVWADMRHMSSAAPAAGWFADPHDPSRLRWWDGATWTDHLHPPLAASPVVKAAPAIVPVAEAVPAVQPAAAPVAAGKRANERVLEVYHGNEREPGLFGFRFTTRIASFGSGGARSPHGKAIITAVEGETPPFDEAVARAELAEFGLTAEQVESSVQLQAKMASLIERAENNPIARKVAHRVLRKLAFSTARGMPGDAMDVLFDGRRYHAYGRSHRR
ncbi:MAG: hypothetical protein JWL76_1193 [Thermoleophilia bacterium]|nr:hypothetical protein [Thermoleophilia bacterium]